MRMRTVSGYLIHLQSTLSLWSHYWLAGIVTVRHSWYATSMRSHRQLDHHGRGDDADVAARLFEDKKTLRTSKCRPDGSGRSEERGMVDKDKHVCVHSRQYMDTHVE